jgi:hypothetical protein
VKEQRNEGKKEQRNEGMKEQRKEGKQEQRKEDKVDRFESWVRVYFRSLVLKMGNRRQRFWAFH